VRKEKRLNEVQSLKGLVKKYIDLIVHLEK